MFCCCFVSRYVLKINPTTSAAQVKDALKDVGNELYPSIILYQYRKLVKKMLRHDNNLSKSENTWDEILCGPYACTIRIGLFGLGWQTRLTARYIKKGFELLTKRISKRYCKERYEQRLLKVILCSVICNTICIVYGYVGIFNYLNKPFSIILYCM